MRAKKLGFWAVFALVAGSQIGTSVFMTPSTLAPFGWDGLLGLCISGVAAILLGLVFGELCYRFPQTGGPHVYVTHAFGRTPGFFTGWAYWLISWMSSTVVIVTIVGYLSPLLGVSSKEGLLALELGVLILLTLLNLKGLVIAGRFEIILTFFKFAILFLFPLIALTQFDAAHIVALEGMQESGTSLGTIILLTFWGFIGVECATTPAGSVQEPRKVIPRAIFLGTLGVALVYLFNFLSIGGALPSEELVHSQAPYLDVAKLIFGGNWGLLLSIAAALICIGTLNAWIIASSQIALGLAEEGYFPAFFGLKNRAAAPWVSVVISCAGMAPFLVVTISDNLRVQLTQFLDFSVIGFLYVYLLSSLSLIKILWRHRAGAKSYIVPVLASGFCLWFLSLTALEPLLVALVCPLLGVPLYFFWFQRKEKRESLTEKN